MSRFKRMMRALTATAALLIAAILCWQCFDVYMSRSEEIIVIDAGVADIFRPDDIAARFKALAAPLTACGLVIAVNSLLHIAVPETASEANRRAEQLYLSEFHLSIHQKKLRILILTIALLFILLGVMNGGAYDVLVKAINICTECIGLG